MNEQSAVPFNVSLTKNLNLTKPKRRAKTTPARGEAFALEAPCAASVLLAGDFTQWQEKPISLEHLANGHWQANVPLKPGRHQYRFLVDGQWQDDPQAAERVANPFGGCNAVRTVI
jgi:1,4-alpha-glucan branching enzyme